MMNSKKVSLFITVSTIIFSALTSCSSRLVGTWNVAKYETITPGKQNILLNNIGTITFNGNNSDEKNLNFQIMGIERKDQLKFDWTATEKYVTIKNGGEEFSKIWIILENKKNFQKWRSTDGTNQIQVIELNK